MAAIDLQRGLEHSGHGWGQERPDLMDSFDSEMQEWEDQLQDMQRKIEELYNEVQARRGGGDISIDNRKDGQAMEFGLGHNGNGFFDASDDCTNGSKGNPEVVMTPKQNSNGLSCSPNGYSCSNGSNGYGYPAGHKNGYAYCNTNGVSDIGDLLQDYLGQGKETRRKTNGARHVHFNDTIKVSQDFSEYRKPKSGNESGKSHDKLSGSLEEAENRKNRMSQAKGSPNKENVGAKPPLRQRDAPSVPPRSASQHPNVPHDSPALDKKSFNPVVLVDKSPSVLRKFGAMLHENEGKMLTDTGVVTHPELAQDSKCPTPGCQRRALETTTAAGRAPVRVPAQRCQADSDALTAKTEPSQERGLIMDSGRQSHVDQRGSHGYCAGPQPSPQQSHRRSQVAGSPKLRPRANSGSERDMGLAQGERTRRPTPRYVEPRVDHKALSGSSSAQRAQRGRDDGLVELLDMLEIQHEYNSSTRAGHTPYRQDRQQVNPAESSPVSHKKTFSRPARPANQRPPSRWASCTPTARITAPSGPMYRPPSPLARPASPMTQTPSPALKHQPLIRYSLHTETVIM